MKILWAITGAGHFLEEMIGFMRKKFKKDQVTVAFSNAGLEVAKMYGFFKEIREISQKVILEKNQGASFPLVMKVSQGEYSLILVAPCTANSIAKIAYGIADSLITNLVAQAIKSKIPVIILPTDFKKKTVTKPPKGEKFTIHLRDVDLNNVKKVEKQKGIEVVKKVEEIKL